MHTIYDSDYMEMDIGIAYRFLDNNTVLTEPHDHNYYEYFIVTSGAIIHKVNGHSKRLKTGDLVFIRPRDCHQYLFKDSENCQMINVSFQTRHFDNMAAYFNSPILDRLIESETSPIITLSSAATASIKKKHNMLNAPQSKTKLVTLLKTLIIDVFSYFMTEFDDSNKDASQNSFQSFLLQMNTPENIEEGLPALIRISGFSHGHLCRIMKKELGVTPIQYITNLRLEYAANLLISSDYEIITIATQLGFSSLSHFIVIFKNKYGMPPSKYRALYSNISNWK